MHTIVSDWQVVSVLDNQKLVGKVLWGTCVDDMTCRFFSGDFICTSCIEKIFPSAQAIVTSSGSLYHVLGEGISTAIDYKDFELLRNGFSPENIAKLNKASVLKLH